MAQKEMHPLLAWRTRNKISLTMLAKDLGTSPSYLSEIENRKKEPSLIFARHIRERTKISIDTLADHA